MENVTVQIDSKWVGEVRSARFKVVAALTGVSFTFAPYFLFLSGLAMGKTTGLPRFGWGLVALLCYAIVHYVGRFHIRLGGAVVRELMRHPST